MRRRDLLIGATAAAMAARGARAQPHDRDARLSALLDAIQPGTDTASSLRRLEHFGAAGLSSSARLDRDAVMWGLAVDRDIAVRTSPGAATSGEARFMLMFERQFGARMTAHDVQDRLDAKVAETTDRADRLLRDQGLTSGSVGARFRAFARDPRWVYSDDAAGRARAVADMNRSLAQVRPRLAALVADVPATVDGATVRALSDAEIAAGRQGFRDPGGDGRPPAYAVDLRDIARRPSWSLPGVVHHELLPGHLPQQALQARAAPHRLRLHYAPSFAEGWAIYAEEIAEEDGLLADDPPATLGHLQWMLFRLGRAVIDTGVHARGWDAAMARRWLEDHQGDPAVFAPFDRDIDRIAGAAGNRAAEAMTWLALADLRRRLAPMRGTRMAHLHHRILQDGPMPFALLTARLGGSRATSRDL